MTHSTHHQDFNQQLKQAGLNPPKQLTLGITGACNLHCRHCWLNCGSQSIQSEVPTATLQRLIGEFADLNGTGICLSGGEPLTHRDWFEILRSACDRSCFSEIRLQTNATRIGDNEARLFKSLACNRLVIQVSLDGATPKTHDFVRGKGSYARAIKGLLRLCANGLAHQIQLVFTEMNHNFLELPRLLKLADENGIAKVISSTLVKAGRATNDHRISLPEPSHYRALLDLYHNDPLFRTRYKKIGTIAAIEWFKGRNHSQGETCSCIENPYLTAEGVLYPCVMFQAASVATRNAHSQPLALSILQALPAWAKLPAMQRRRQAEVKQCRACPGLKHCAGGCMGRAQAVYDDPLTSEDRCSLRQAIYTWTRQNQQ